MAGGRLFLARCAAAAVETLDGDAADDILAFVRSRVLPEGGVAGRDGQPDVYYAAFAAEILQAFHRPVPRETAAYARRLEPRDHWDLPHLGSWIRLRSLSRQPVDKRHAAWGADMLDTCRDSNGLFRPARNAPRGSAYGTYLALLVAEDLAVPRPVIAPETAGSLQALERTGLYADREDSPAGTATSTLAALCALQAAGARIPATVPVALARLAHPAGGYLAGPEAPVPDLLSTAAALMGLLLLRTSPTLPARRATEEFIERLWADDGGFRGCEPDPVTDVEYTWYALLALGALHLLDTGG